MIAVAQQGSDRVLAVAQQGSDRVLKVSYELQDVVQHAPMQLTSTIVEASGQLATVIQQASVQIADVVADVVADVAPTLTAPLNLTSKTQDALNVASLTPPRDGKQFHCFCSLDNAGARALLTEVVSEMRFGKSLMVCDVATQLTACEFMLVYLTRDTWGDSITQKALEEQVLTALQGHVPILLAHEEMGADEEARRAVKFEHLIETTPAPLKKAGVYRTIAVPLRAGILRHASLAMLAQMLGKTQAKAQANAKANGLTAAEQPGSNRKRAAFFVDASLNRFLRRRNRADSDKSTTSIVAMERETTAPRSFTRGR